LIGIMPFYAIMAIILSLLRILKVTFQRGRHWPHIAKQPKSWLSEKG